MEAHQYSYTDRAPSLKVVREPKSIISKRGEATYTSFCSRPDVTCASEKLSEAAEDKADKSAYKRLDAVFKRIKNA